VSDAPARRAGQEIVMLAMKVRPDLKGRRFGRCGKSQCATSAAQATDVKTTLMHR